jgi:hypothetical protein
MKKSLINEKKPITREKLKRFSQEVQLLIFWPKTPDNPKSFDGFQERPPRKRASYSETKNRLRSF